MQFKYGARFALAVAGHGCIRYENRRYGINLGWSSDAPFPEWEFRRAGVSGNVDPKFPLALYNRVADDCVVCAERSYGISLRWARDARRADPHEWVVEGDFPVFRLKNLAAARRGDAYLLYGEQRYGINLVWGRRPAGGNFFLEPLAEPALPDAGDYVPGEASISTRRPQTWAVEWDGREGLDFEAYATPIRSPYIQNVTCDAATVLWRVGIPKGWDPRAWAGRLQARAWVAPAGTATTGGTLYRTGDATRPIEAGDATGTYQYESGVTFDHDVPSGSGENDYWLNRLSDRPVIRFRVTFRDLRPGTVYHYRVECEGVADDQDRRLANLVLADDVTFRTAPDPTGNPRVRFVAMGDLGPGDGQPSYFYDVFDLFHNVCRSRGPHLWLALGDIDNDTDGHPNAMDPFFFHVYNAYHGRKDPRLTSHTRAARRTTVKAFRSPPYCGLLGGLPVYPTFGNHDICNKGWPSSVDGCLAYWQKAYRGGFDLPSAGWDGASARFNTGSGGFFYTFRHGNVIFLSLGIPDLEGCDLGNGRTWTREWAARQEEALRDYLASLRGEIEKTDVWLVVYLHDHHAIIDDGGKYPELFLRYGVDLALAGHQHFFRHRTVWNGPADYRAVVAGVGGFGDTDPGDDCKRPGFVLAEVQGNVLRYWKYDTHRCDAEGKPRGRDALAPAIREYCRITKTGFGRHIVESTEG
ncbi:MAG: hypothetical protein A4E67_00909 [Syntrophaceae bacterium PtaB.Bin038]|nr:MAG: hypothetical protein A4E67_00909 [Syntrophaceae bacterium PtaB.Bin038]